MPTAPTWTPEEEQRLIQVCKTAQTVAEVAQATGRTRNSVIGKARRLASQGRIETHWLATRDRTKVEKSKKRVRAATKNRNAPSVRSTILPSSTPPQLPAEPVIPMRRISILELEAGRCRWPLDDPEQLGGFAFCGNAAPVDRPYCRVHDRAAHIGPARR